MYWIESGSIYIKSSDMTGSAAVDLSACSSTKLAGLTLRDISTSETIYWGDGTEEKVKRTELVNLFTSSSLTVLFQIFECKKLSNGHWSKSVVANFTIFDIIKLNDIEPVSLRFYKDSLYLTDRNYKGLVRLYHFLKSLSLARVEEMLTTERSPGAIAVYNSNRTSGLSY